MNAEHYTSDAICRAMGFSGFVDPSWIHSEKPSMRIVLTPSFQPELCLTLGQGIDAAYLSVAALAQQFWSRPEEVHRETYREKVSLSASSLAEFIGMFEVANAASGQSKRYIPIDGMGADSCLVSSGFDKKLRTHISALLEMRILVCRLLQVLWSGCSDPRVRNAISRTAAYVDIDLPLQDVPLEKPTTRILVLGTPEERRDYLTALEKNMKIQG